MTPAETATLLAAMAAVDYRKIGDADVLAWHAILGRFDLPICQDAVVHHYMYTTDRIMPAHIVKFIRRQDPHQGHLEQW